MGRRAAVIPAGVGVIPCLFLWVQLRSAFPGASGGLHIRQELWKQLKKARAAQKYREYRYC